MTTFVCANDVGMTFSLMLLLTDVKDFVVAVSKHPMFAIAAKTSPVLACWSTCPMQWSLHEAIQGWLAVMTFAASRLVDRTRDESSDWPSCVVRILNMP